VDEFGRENPRLDPNDLCTLADRTLGVPELEPNIESAIAEWVAMEVREFRLELAAAADERRRVALVASGVKRETLDVNRVERFAQKCGPYYRLRECRLGTGETVYAQVTETLEQRIAVELIDMLRLSPKLSRCPRCGRIRVGDCGAYLVRRGLVIETCDGRTLPPDLDEERRKLKEAMRKQVYRLGCEYGRSHALTQRAREEYLREFPLAKRGPPAKVPRLSVLAEDRPGGP
jgi:hypothetical protein